MKTVFRAAHALEAHMIKHLLELEHIPAFISGEFLQGGVGDLQAHDLVQVGVHDADYEQARQIVARWEAEQPSAEVNSAQPAASRDSRSRYVGIFLLGVLVGVLLS
ncbi:DUF2007 domain-containing protein [Methylobacillus flagellatus]|uniref:putative signal transducing protein n=1 Tax=Methylobacillus flagellatus TaxID=405 RepID=UPI002571164D|nr:DUF2007 domain-containing protein [Methylobacillus flagellatus]